MLAVCFPVRIAPQQRSTQPECRPCRARETKASEVRRNPVPGGHEEVMAPTGSAALLDSWDLTSVTKDTMVNLMPPRPVLLLATKTRGGIMLFLPCQDAYHSYPLLGL